MPELSAFGELDDRAERAAKLTEGAELLGRLWTEERVQHRSGAWVVDDVQVHLPVHPTLGRLASAEWRY